VTRSKESGLPIKTGEGGRRVSVLVRERARLGKALEPLATIKKLMGRRPNQILCKKKEQAMGRQTNGL